MFTIQSVIISELLKFETKEISGKKVKVGLTYDEILKNVQEECRTNELLPDDISTSKECISWYASKMRNSGTKYYDKNILDIVRPRKSNKKQTGTKVAVKK